MSYSFSSNINLEETRNYKEWVLYDNHNEKKMLWGHSKQTYHLVLKTGKRFPKPVTPGTVSSPGNEYS